MDPLSLVFCIRSKWPPILLVLAKQSDLAAHILIEPSDCVAGLSGTERVNKSASQTPYSSSFHSPASTVTWSVCFCFWCKQSVGLSEIGCELGARTSYGRTEPPALLVVTIPGTGDAAAARSVPRAGPMPSAPHRSGAGEAGIESRLWRLGFSARIMIKVAARVRVRARLSLT